MRLGLVCFLGRERGDTADIDTSPLYKVTAYMHGARVDGIAFRNGMALGGILGLGEGWDGSQGTRLGVKRSCAAYSLCTISKYTC